MTIDRCLCFGKPFAELAEVADATGAETVAELQEHALFGRKCALCHPYVRRMLRTGQTVFHEVVTEADEPEAGASQPEERRSGGDGVWR
ncbi:(2Fe-2S)-binding protein [Rubrivirga marina]|uniref:(2Fe-2S)-binding protein n=1 Tax=Rubrivirga marina TaxID=1196024 RepID=A0A271IWM7_9BACT|nr:(2Fe-2S)-binding protein [Rubrivirga marina]PAP75592.1 (2Fe-2S)-binding protein [Rubrivirga marina]